MISINPVITTNAAGTFSISLDGLMQGMAMDDPAIRYQLTGGQLAATETLPMFGGVPICESLPPTGSLWEPALQNSITRAIAALGSVGGVSGYSVFNQNHAMINSVSSPVPQADSGMLVNFYRVGSRARIAFAMDPALVLQVAAPGYPVMPSALFWSPANQWVTATATGGFALPTTTNVIGYNLGNSMIVEYNSTTGFATWNRQGDAILLEV
jgi:hypothetical protein